MATVLKACLLHDDAEGSSDCHDDEFALADENNCCMKSRKEASSVLRTKHPQSQSTFHHFTFSSQG